MATTTSSVNRHSTSIINCGFCVMSHSSQIIQLSISLQKTDRNSGKTTICQCIQLQQSKYDSYIRFIYTILDYESNWTCISDLFHLIYFGFALWKSNWMLAITSINTIVVLTHYPNFDSKFFVAHLLDITLWNVKKLIAFYDAINMLIFWRLIKLFLRIFSPLCSKNSNKGNE